MTNFDPLWHLSTSDPQIKGQDSIGSCFKLFGPEPETAQTNEGQTQGQTQVQTKGRVIFACPHSGRYYPQTFLEASNLSPLTLRSTEDGFVDDLLGLRDTQWRGGAFERAGLWAIKALWARAYVDVNRHPLELDPLLIDGRLPKGSLSQTERVKAGFGVVARSLGPGLSIYRQPLSLNEVLERIEKGHRPYHQALAGRIQRLWSLGRGVVVLDWHSMPSKGLRSKADVVLGDLHGQSCQAMTLKVVKRVFEAHGFRVALNQPFAGGYTTDTYGAPHKGIETLQIELRRDLYMDEALIAPNPQYQRFKSRLQTVALEIIEALNGLKP